MAQPIALLNTRVQQLLRELRRLPQSAPRFFTYLWKEQRHWLLPLIPFLFLVYRPMRLTWGTWFSSVLMIQAFVPVLALYLAWTQRSRYTTVYNEFKQMWPPESKRRRGHPWVILLGCIMMLISALAIVPSLSVFALVVMVIGIVYYVYGWFVLRMLWAPLLFLTLMTPPGNLHYRLIGPFSVGNASALGIALHSLFPQIKTPGNVVTLPNINLVITPELSGLGVVIPILILTIWLALRRGVLYYNYPVLLVLTGTIALLVNFIRLLLVAVVINSNPVIGNGLAKINAWFLVLIAFLLVRPIVDRFRPRRLSQIGEEESMAR